MTADISMIYSANFTRDFVEGQFELESLNFVEATHLALILLEYIIDKYQKLMNCKLSPETRSSLEVIFQKKQKLLSGLKKEYEKRRYK